MIFKNYSFNYFDIYDSILLKYLPIPILLLHIISLNQLFIQNLHKNHLFAEITGYLPVLKSLKQILESAGVITDKKHITRNGNVFRIRFPKDSCLKLIRYMYKGSPKYYLRRKYGIAKDYLDRLNEKDL